MKFIHTHTKKIDNKWNLDFCCTNLCTNLQRMMRLLWNNFKSRNLFFFLSRFFFFSWIRLHKNDTQQFIVLSVVVVVDVVTLFCLLCLWYFFYLVFAFCTPLQSDSLLHWRYNSHNTATVTLMSLKCYNAY